MAQQQEQDTAYLQSYDSSYNADYDNLTGDYYNSTGDYYNSTGEYYNSTEYDGYQGESDAGYESPDPEHYNIGSNYDYNQSYADDQGEYQMDTQYSVNTGGVGNEDTNYQYDPVTQSYTGYDEAYLTDGETSAYAAVYGADQEYESPDEGHYLAATDGYTTTEEGVEDIPKDPQTVETKEEKSQKDSEAEKTSIQEGLQVSLNDTSSAPDTTDSKPEVGDGAYTNKRLKRIRAGRVKKRQDLLENEEEKKMLVVAAEAAAAASIARGSVVVPNENNQRAASRPLVGFIEREKAKINLQIKKAKAIARKRVPVQVRVFTDTRKRLSPLEKYFGGSVEPVLSDIYWSARKNDLQRVKHLVEIETVDVKDSQFDPWNLHQTPLHWAAKGGAAHVAEYLLKAGASARSLDDNGSTPLHLACWGGHVDATLMILRFVDHKDLYVRDWDAGLAPLDWANIRGHTELITAIGKFEDSIWLPKFVENLIEGIIKYKIKMSKPGPKIPIRTFAKPPALVSTKEATSTSKSTADTATADEGSTSPENGPKELT